MPPLRRAREEHGFTIIEVMVASLVLLVGILGVTTIVNTANSTTTSNKAREQGLSLARDIIESARSVRYQNLRPANVVGTLQATPGFANAGAGPGWTIRRRGIVYTVSIGVCSVDDPGDGTGAHAANQYCTRSTVQASAATCQDMIGMPPKINGNGSSGADAGDCGLDSDLDGQVNGLVQGAATGCPTGTSVSAGTCDPQPDDFKRLVTLVTWDRGAGSRYVLEQATEPFPGLSAYGAMTDLTLRGRTAGANGYTVGNVALTDKPDKLTFDATSSQAANQVDWLLGGVDQGPATWSGTTGYFTWNLGNDAPESETVPDTAAGEVLDGTYLVGARVQDAGGIHGTELTTTVVLNRRKPFPPSGFQIAANGGGVTATWNAPPDGDIVGYRLWWNVGAGTPQPVTGCGQVTDLTCTDTSPPGNASVTYFVTALDRDPAGAVRPGQSSVTRTIQTGNAPPTTPTITSGSGKGNSVTITWTASTDPDDPLDSYELYRSGCTASTLVGKALATQTSLTDSTAPNKSTCIYNVRAKDQGGAYSAFSPDFTVKT